MQDSTADLLERAADGDEAAWEAIVERFGGLVWSVARSFRLDAHSAADVSQTTWLRLVENLGRIRHPERLAGWLATTTRREALRLKRQGSRVVPTTAFEDTSAASPDPIGNLVAVERRASVAAAFHDLSQRCQELLRLLLAEPRFEYVEIAAIIGRPVGSIGPSRARCLEHLRRRLDAADPY